MKKKPALAAKHLGDGKVTVVLVEDPGDETPEAMHLWTCSPETAETLVQQLREAIRSARQQPS